MNSIKYTFPLYSFILSNTFKFGSKIVKSGVSQNAINLLAIFTAIYAPVMLVLYYFLGPYFVTFLYISYENSVCFEFVKYILESNLTNDVAEPLICIFIFISGSAYFYKYVIILLFYARYICLLILFDAKYFVMFGLFVIFVIGFDILFLFAI